jgi:hypothetical protein
MKQISFAIPISKVIVLADLERRCEAWDLPRFAFQLLERWYGAGWDDGFAEFDRHELTEGLAVKPRDLDAAIELLADLQLVRVRRGLGHEVAELLALSTAHQGGSPYLGWWQVYLVEMEGFDD